jgi:hypothetical protein
MSREAALVLYVAACAAAALLWLFGPFIKGWAP